MINSVNSYLNNQYVAFKNLNENTNSNSENTKNLNLVTHKSQAVSESLGYGVDKDGYFTSYFNEVAEIASDYKIYAKGTENLADYITNSDFTFFTSLDIAKTIANAYKILSQVVGYNILNSKDSFSIYYIANFPQGYEFNRQSMQVGKIYNTSTDYLNEELHFNFKNNTNTLINNLFFC
ncbi:Cj0814 family flagellar-dependent secreted protein [Campylobacter sp. LR185c]|uniref:Cj0814 family flagellar-dependent secreted protein n=1 Tax=Campylobacter sp. LR185c TaxID=2014525 RepID=UPI0012398C37|nr:hypothetical protein [Campylobacter sp. LR185c]KAA8604810.1 hypothetical protein CGP82_00060 [Campylobacter sp. LR185c]